jgi:tetratricopeptide (TPR) repeat protein
MISRSPVLPFDRSTILALALVWAPDLVAAQDTMSRAFDLERRGSYAQAAEVYKSILKSKPAEVSALLGLERALTPINRLQELLPAVQAAIEADPASPGVFGVGMRAFAAANLLDSLPRLVELWARAAPGDETPYREWATAALQRRDRPMARRAYQLGRERLGKPEVLAAEIAQLASLEEDWPTAVREWTRAVRQLPGYRTSAITALGQAPERTHQEILKALDKEPGIELTRISVDLRARWGDPVGAFDALMKSLPPGNPQQIDALQAFLEETRVESTRPYLITQARTLEAIAERWISPTQRSRFLLDAARAYAASGDPTAARRMLSRIASDTTSGPAVAAGATATLIDLLVKENKADEASTQLEKYRSTISVDDYLRLRRAIAARWAQAGEITRGEGLLASDSSVEALALRGRFRLYAGDLKGVADLWKQAGPFAGTREESTDRSAILAMIQPIAPDTLVGLGLAFRSLDAGDTLAAARTMEQAGKDIPVDGGRAEVTLYAGRLYAAAGQAGKAESDFRAAVLKDAPNTSAAALLELGRLFVAQDRRPEATQVLEQMILDYPTSALLPQARRLLDQVRGGVPKT